MFTFVSLPVGLHDYAMHRFKRWKRLNDISLWYILRFSAFSCFSVFKENRKTENFGKPKKPKKNFSVQTLVSCVYFVDRCLWCYDFERNDDRRNTKSSRSVQLHVPGKWFSPHWYQQTIVVSEGCYVGCRQKKVFQQNYPNSRDRIFLLT